MWNIDNDTNYFLIMRGHNLIIESEFWMFFYRNPLGPPFIIVHSQTTQLTQSKLEVIALSKII